MPFNRLLISAACLILLFGCASSRKKTETPPAAGSSSSQPAPKGKVAGAPARSDGRKVKSRDGKVDGEIFGTPARGSKFAKVEIGMSRIQVEKLIGTPDDAESHVTGRQFAPFYFGGDTQRYEAFYKGEGQLSYSNNTRFSAPDTLIVITVDRREKGVRH
ncbi:MAG: hypothetical protein WBO23_13590 [Burkholderiales bacterium]